MWNIIFVNTQCFSMEYFVLDITCSVIVEVYLSQMNCSPILMVSFVWLNIFFFHTLTGSILRLFGVWNEVTTLYMYMSIIPDQCPETTAFVVVMDKSFWFSHGATGAWAIKVLIEAFRWTDKIDLSVWFVFYVVLQNTSLVLHQPILWWEESREAYVWPLAHITKP